MTSSAAPFTLQQIGTGTARFPSGAAIPTSTDAAVDPYSRTKVPKHTQVETIMFWPQEKGTYPGVVLLHEWWGLNSQIKDFGAKLACEGYAVIIPNLYGRIGGMVTANADVAEALMSKVNETDLLQDINSCCEFLNTREYVKRNIHGVVGIGMGGSLALRFACQRKRLRGAVSFYGRVDRVGSAIKDLYCPLLYHHAGRNTEVTEDELRQLETVAAQQGKRVEVRVYSEALPAFMNETRSASYNEAAASSAWETTVTFLKQCFQGV